MLSSQKIEKLDPTDLIIPGHLNDEKLLSNSQKRSGKVVVVYEDECDGKRYVVDGRHATIRAKMDGTLVDCVILGENDMVGRQNALDRTIGMLLGGERER